MIEIMLTREDSNSESALLVEWLLGDREPVSRGQPVCVIETSKSAIEIESPSDGTLCHLAQEGQELELGRRIAIVAANDEELSEVAALREPGHDQHAASKPGKATRKAIELAAAHGIDLATITKTGFITAEDVLALSTERESALAARPASVLGEIALERVSLPTLFGLDDEEGALEPEFLELLRTDPDAIRALPADERLALYVKHGARIGAGVRLGDRSVIVAAQIVLENGVEIGEDSTIECSESFRVGALTRFGARLRLGCRRVVIGSGGHIGEDVQIGGGGRADPQALLVVGDLVYLGAEAFINPCRPVVIGREVFVTMRSVIVTHNIGHSLLEGFENRFAPVVLEDRVQVGIGAVVYAGTRIGSESIIASNSYVVSDIPAGKLAVGVPARVSGNSRRTLTPVRRDALARGLIDELRELLTLRGHELEPLPPEYGVGFSVIADGSTSQVLFAERVDGDFGVRPIDGETVILTLALDGATPHGASVLDLLERRVHGSGGAVLDSVREFCRKRGIRFEPGPWKYRRGLV